MLEIMAELAVQAAVLDKMMVQRRRVQEMKEVLTQLKVMMVERATIVTVVVLAVAEQVEKVQTQLAQQVNHLSVMAE
tara:strand:- start:285 stop:515 length:231 start_codon:yes stop_codon:yes gene_type:complete